MVVRRGVVVTLVVCGVLLTLGTLLAVRLFPSWADPLSAAGTMLGAYVPIAILGYAVLVGPWAGPRR
ncbi:hypothetical protein DKG34_40680 [Streptomyces sp. NWU49]|uniref:hypothetical protein n=1 Tax=Streptomyces sp. NWU49 TaxID=2201153 RepID=UPI000D673ECF|nr:hypothetical protein [Streptomyces sp. NWU49]PWJ02069.1 hypothetical protein DKG34_40680 [Streptomyces sp. NWU49]